jgi:hypothetical protein
MAGYVSYLRGRTLETIREHPNSRKRTGGTSCNVLPPAALPRRKGIPLSHSQWPNLSLRWRSYGWSSNFLRPCSAYNWRIPI